LREVDDTRGFDSASAAVEYDIELMFKRITDGFGVVQGLRCLG
jgi:hypothetical protein